MDDFTLFIIILIFVAVISRFSTKPRKISEGTKVIIKKTQDRAVRVGVLILIESVLGLIAFFCFMSGGENWGIFLVVIGILIIMGFMWLYEGEKKEIEEMNKKQMEIDEKQEKEEIYQTELIKEKARLQARKEQKKK